MLLQQGWYEDELDYLLERLPEADNDFSPVVYELLWKSLTYEEYLAIIEVLNRRERFSPAAIAEAVGLEDGGRRFFQDVHPEKPRHVCRPPAGRAARVHNTEWE